MLGLEHLGCGLGGAAVSKGRQGSSAVESTPAWNLHQAPALPLLSPTIMEIIIALCKVMTEVFSSSIPWVGYGIKVGMGLLSQRSV